MAERAGNRNHAPDILEGFRIEREYLSQYTEREMVARVLKAHMESGLEDFFAGGGLERG